MGDTTGLDAPALIRLGMGFWASKVLFSAVELGVSTDLAARGPAPAGELASRLGLHGRGSLDFLDALVALGVLAREDGVYDNTPIAALHLDRARPDSYLGHFFEFAGTEWYPAWQTLTDALRTGKPQNNGKDSTTDPFEAIYDDPDRVRRFQQMQSSMSLGPTLALAERFPWARHTTVADIGCSEGAFLIRLLGRHPHLTAVGFDLPQVGPRFTDAVGAAGLTDRIAFTEGDFFTDPLPRADVLSFGHVLHDWDVPTRRMLLRKAHEALPTGGTVILREALIDDDRSGDPLPLLVSLHMLIETPGGSDYTGADGRRWLADAGFHDLRVEHLAGSVSMITGRK
ncbi:methyltransferase [Streptomyces roseirectus]|uniref:Methyltransferase n=1 Tax=Streptomyces roseirectus TaxID=2768066 RepID=A0A7H0IPW4_9ACTN|nr:methyltransferase [Streptomyces roseirectus]QNP74830.1 methyltransferase [Streptomyces roseirectus]